MKIIEEDLKHGVVKVQIETIDDLWILYNILREDDIVYAKTTREVKIGDKSEGSRIPMILGLRAKKIEFQEFSDKLRVSGIVVDGPDKYGVIGKHHSFTIGIGDVVIIVKEEWNPYELKLLKYQTWGEKILVVSIDHDEACIALLGNQGVKYLWEGSLNLPSKRYNVDYNALIEEYLDTVVQAIVQALRNEDPKAIVIVGPGDIKNQLKNALSQFIKLPLYTDSTSTGGCKGVSEAVNRDLVKTIANELTLVKAASILEEFKVLLVKDHELVAYGVQQVKEAAINGAVEKLLILDELIRSPDDETRREVYEALRHTHEKRGEVIIVPSKSDIGAELAGFGGVVAVLRFKLPLSLEESPQ